MIPRGPDGPPKTLLPSEWLLVSSLLIIIASLFCIAQIGASRAFSSLPLKEAPIEAILVTIEGAVAKPGEYLIPAGTTVETALRKARLKPLANTQGMPLKQIIEAPLHLKVEEFTEIVVFVRGEVSEPVELVLPAGSRISDLKTKISLNKEADKSFFRRRKLLKNREIIEVPKKVVE